MDFVEFTAGKDDNDRRLDKILRRLCNEKPLSQLYKAIRKGLVKVNGKSCSETTRILTGDIIKIAAFLTQSKKSSDKEKSLASLMPEIIFQNEHLLIMNKPYGLLSQPNSKNSLSLDKILLDYYTENFSSDSISFTPSPLHRLDKNTTGLIVCSLSLEGARWFSENINSHRIEKKYLGIVKGNLKEKQIWQDKLSDKKEKDSFYTIKASHSEEDSNCWTCAEPVEHGKYNNLDVTLVEFHIKTGKHHQIRAQASLHEYPLLGDCAYGCEKTDLKQEYYLHAASLSIKENPINLPEEIKCTLPSEFKTALKTCGMGKIEV
ncbi:MAG: RluA family pseudouridine synthase [Treponema sp.]|nr:RluA family pseudouridine synthase [Treponema sp.]